MGKRRKGRIYTKKIRRKYAHGYRSDGVRRKREPIDKEHKEEIKSLL